MTTLEYVKCCKGLYQAQKASVDDLGTCLGFDGKIRRYETTAEYERSIMELLETFQKHGDLESDITPEYAIQLLNGDYDD